MCGCETIPMAARKKPHCRQRVQLPQTILREHDRNSSLKKALENLFHARPNKPREHNEVLAKVKYLKEKNSMKQPKKLTRNQKEIIKKVGKEPADYMLHSEDGQEMILYNKREKRLESVKK